MSGDRSLKDIVAKRIECFKRRPEAALYTPKVTTRHIRKLCPETRVREHLVKSDSGEGAGGQARPPGR